MQAEQARRLSVILGGSVFALLGLNELRFTVEPGHTAILFSKFTGLGNVQYKEGWHLRLPYFHTPIDFNIQTRPKQIKAATANKGITYTFKIDMQIVNLTLRVLYRPMVDQIPTIYR